MVMNRLWATEWPLAAGRNVQQHISVRAGESHLRHGETQTLDNSKRPPLPIVLEPAPDAGWAHGLPAIPR